MNLEVHQHATYERAALINIMEMVGGDENRSLGGKNLRPPSSIHMYKPCKYPGLHIHTFKISLQTKAI